jgi:RNA polymerase sigma-70 factor, ECF subfamily
MVGRLTGRRARVPAAPAAEPGLGSEAELRAAYAAHGGELYRFALRQLGDEGAAQEVVQEVFLRAWRRSDTFDPSLASLRGWLFAIARNAVIDESRRLAVRPWRRSLFGDPDDGASSSGSVPGVDRAVVDGWVVEEALRRIRPEHREAIVQTYLLGRPYAEVAGEAGIPLGTLRSRVFYGLKALRLAMDEMGVEQ